MPGLHGQRMTALVEAQNICVRAGGSEVLHDVSLRVTKGEIVTILGPNGSGKSTLLRALLGILPVSHGRVSRSPGLRIGWLGDWGGAYPMEPGILALVEAGLARFAEMGAIVEPLKFTVPAGFDWPVAGNRREYLRGRLEQGRATVYRNQSSGVLRSAAWADGLVEVLEGRTLSAGDPVVFIPLSDLLG